MTINAGECQHLIKKYSGKGHMVNAYQEIVCFKKPIGKIELRDGTLVKTKWGKIQYSKTGSHLVPYYNKKENK